MLSHDYKVGRTYAFDVVEEYLRGVRDHAAKRIHRDGTALDVRQEARLLTAMRAIEWIRAKKAEEAKRKE